MLLNTTQYCEIVLVFSMYLQNTLHIILCVTTYSQRILFIQQHNNYYYTDRDKTTTVTNHDFIGNNDTEINDAFIQNITVKDLEDETVNYIEVETETDMENVTMTDAHINYVVSVNDNSTKPDQSLPTAVYTDTELNSNDTIDDVYDTNQDYDNEWHPIIYQEHSRLQIGENHDKTLNLPSQDISDPKLSNVVKHESMDPSSLSQLKAAELKDQNNAVKTVSKKPSSHENVKSDKSLNDNKEKSFIPVLSKSNMFKLYQVKDLLQEIIRQTQSESNDKKKSNILRDMNTMEKTKDRQRGEGIQNTEREMGKQNRDRGMGIQDREGDKGILYTETYMGIQQRKIHKGNQLTEKKLRKQHTEKDKGIQNTERNNTDKNTEQTPKTQAKKQEQAIEKLKMEVITTGTPILLFIINN